MTDARLHEPTLVDHEAFDVVGLSARTSAAREADPLTAVVPRLWQRFFDENVSRRVPDAVPGRVATAYVEYSGGGDRAYTVVLGPVARHGDGAPRGLARVHVPAGTYLEFPVDGMPPDAVTAAWSRVHDWFAATRSYRRAYRVDFELLRPGATAIFISVFPGADHAE